ncbi:MAG: hypothetical protein KAT00_02245 [Planctomycetes bacterium]|nr:hypothetical protein [Planctomycetota bacterium]
MDDKTRALDSDQLLVGPVALVLANACGKPPASLGFSGSLRRLAAPRPVAQVAVDSLIAHGVFIELRSAAPLFVPKLRTLRELALKKSDQHRNTCGVDYFS